MKMIEEYTQLVVKNNKKIARIPKNHRYLKYE